MTTSLHMHSYNPNNQPEQKSYNKFKCMSPRCVPAYHRPELITFIYMFTKGTVSTHHVLSNPFYVCGHLYNFILIPTFIVHYIHLVINQNNKKPTIPTYIQNLILTNFSMKSLLPVLPHLLLELHIHLLLYQSLRLLYLRLYHL